jgi:hypothetical protein
MNSRAYAVEGTAQEFLDRYEPADVTERQTLLVLIKGLEDGVSWANASKLMASPASIASRQDFLSAAGGPDYMLRREVEARPDIGRGAVATGHDRDASQGVSMQAAKTFVVRCRRDDRRQSSRTRIILEC